jgi:aryl-alcohol dehydrogenase-like predicted oxidoreductase
MTTLNNLPGGTYHLGDLEVTRVGYGAMQLSGPGIFGPPQDRDEAIAVLREAVEMGINHIDTSDYYGPYVTNEIIREALEPYPEGLCIVTKVGGARDDEGAWVQATSPDQLRRAVHDNLERLGLDVLDVVNLRNMPEGDGETPWAEQFETLAALQQEGLIRHLGVSTVDADEVRQAQAIAPVVCVQNHYNVAHRTDDALIVSLAEQDIAYVPYFPLGGFTPLQSQELDQVAADLGATPLAVALAWLLQRSPNILLIPGTSSRAHLRENVAGAGLDLPADALARLDAIATEPR